MSDMEEETPESLISVHLGWELGGTFERACRRTSTEVLQKTLTILEQPDDPSDSEWNKRLYEYGIATIHEILKLGASELEREYMEVTVRRAKEWDDKPPTLANLLAAGWTYECHGCYRRLSEETATIVETWEIYCDVGCKTKAAERDAQIDGFNAGAAFRNRELMYDDAVQRTASMLARVRAVAELDQ